MYRCYCKIIKRIKELEKELQEKDNSLSETVQDIREELNANTQIDIVQQNQINQLEIGGGGSLIDSDDINSLFDNP